MEPLLFIIYINDIINIDNRAKYIIYANNTSLCFEASHVKAAISIANETLEVQERCLFT